MKIEPEVYYIKKGRKYIPFDKYQIDGVGEGLWLIWKEQHSKVMKNASYYAQVHEIKNLGRWADLCANFESELASKATKEIERLAQEKGQWSVRDIVDALLKTVADNQ